MIKHHIPIIVGAATAIMALIPFISQAEGHHNHKKHCREYTQKITIGHKTKTAYGTACRQADGAWALTPASVKTTLHHKSKVVKKAHHTKKKHKHHAEEVYYKPRHKKPHHVKKRSYRSSFNHPHYKKRHHFKSKHHNKYRRSHHGFHSRIHFGF